MWEQFQQKSQQGLWLENYGDLPDAKGKGKRRENTVLASAISTSPPNTPPPAVSLTDFHAAWDKSSIHSKPRYSTPYTPYDTDGAAVTSLLADPLFEPNFTPSTTSFDDSPPEPYPSTSAGPPIPAPLTPFSLIPDLVSVLASPSPEVVEASRSPSSMREYLYSIPGLGEWVELDEWYQEDVWGYLHPYMQAAREEVSEQRATGKAEGGGQGPAVRRLGMILRQLKDGKSRIA
jgi:hypothetical protein